MTLTVMTGWSPTGWFEYGRQFLDSFMRYWPRSVNLVVYGEPDVSGLMLQHLIKKSPFSGTISGGRSVKYVDLAAIDGCVEFLAQYDNPIARGRERLPQHHWKERAVAAGYNWRFDAWKFCRQGFIPWHAAHHCETDFLCWLDGDVVTHAHLHSEALITDLLPAGKSIAYLGREPKHPDIAFQLYDLRPGTAEFTHKDFVDDKAVLDWLPPVWKVLAHFARLYRSGDVFELKEWHSAYVWQEAVRIAGAQQVLHNLTPGGSGHVWHQSPLRQWGDHLKGDRKSRGRSQERR